MPSIAPDSARTLTSSPPPFLQRPVISLFSHTHIYSPFHTPPSLFRHCSFLHLTSLISLSHTKSLHFGLSRPMPPTSVIFLLPSIALFCSFTFHHPSLLSSIVLSEHLLFLHLFMIPSFIFTHLHFFLLSVALTPLSLTSGRVGSMLHLISVFHKIVSEILFFACYLNLAPLFSP